MSHPPIARAPGPTPARVSTLRRALPLLPPCAATGIGSLPMTQVELGLQAALSLDVPYLPQLPVGSPGEFMVPAALEGLPGLRFDAEGVCTVDGAAFAAGRARLADALGAALEGTGLEAFEPSAAAARAWRPFLWEVEHRGLAFAKAQLAGPFTVREVVKTEAGAPAHAVEGLDEAVFRLVLARARAMTRGLRRAGAVPLFFLDEPGLFAWRADEPRHLVALQELRLLVGSLQHEGALVGLHCCSNTDWARVMGLGVDVLSLDVRLSLDALLEERSAFARFLDAGSTLSLGVVPTDLASTYRVEELAASVEASLRAALPAGRRFEDVAAGVLLTPACGLAMRSVPDAERILSELRQAQRLLRDATGRLN